MRIEGAVGVVLLVRQLVIQFPSLVYGHNISARPGATALPNQHQSGTPDELSLFSQSKQKQVWARDMAIELLPLFSIQYQIKLYYGYSRLGHIL